MTNALHQKFNIAHAVLFLVVLSTLFVEPSFAAGPGGLTVGQTTLVLVIGWLTTTAAAVATVAFMFVGYRMMFAAAQWKDVAPVFWGAVIIGSAGAIAAVVVA